METLSADFKVNLQMCCVLFFFLWLISDAPRCALAGCEERNTNTISLALYLIMGGHWHLGEGEKKLL